MTVRGMAKAVGFSHATVSKWENGHLVPDPANITAYLGVAGVSGDARDRILGLVEDREDPSWLVAGLAGTSQGLAGVIECERIAIKVVHWAPLLIPGPFQTRETATAIFTAANDTLDPDELEKLIDLRVRRLSLLTGVRDERAGLGPVEYTAMIGEYALHERIGGRDVTIRQLRHLLTMNKIPSITVQVVRSGDDWHPGLSGMFLLYSFADADSIVHIEPYYNSSFLYGEDDIRAYKRAGEAIRRRALSPDDSDALIREILADLENKSG